MNWQKDARTIATLLQNAGYEVQVSDVISAWRAAGAVREIFIDQSGQLRCVETRAPGAPRGKSVARANRKYRVLVEDRCITTITTQLKSAEDLSAVLRDIDAILKKGNA